MQSFVRGAASLLTLFAIAACSGGSPSYQQTSTANQTDSAFIVGASQSSNAEIANGQLALTKSSNADVIAFANEMIQQHSQEKTAMVPVASQVDETPPTTINPTQQLAAAQLMTLTGTAFDAGYINGEIMGHQLNLANNYEPEIAKGSAPGVKAYAVQFEPQIQMHLQMAQQIKAKYGF